MPAGSYSVLDALCVRKGPPASAADKAVKGGPKQGTSAGMRSSDKSVDNQGILKKEDAEKKAEPSGHERTAEELVNSEGLCQKERNLLPGIEMAGMNKTGNDRAFYRQDAPVQITLQDQIIRKPVQNMNRSLPTIPEPG